MNTKVIPLGLAALLGTAGAIAGAEPTHPCARLQDRTERLDCYDATFGKPVAEATAPLQGAVPASAVENFGLSQEQIDRQAPGGAPPKPDSISSTVVSSRRGQDGRFIVTLGNGQAWAQIETNSGAVPAAGDAVTIRRAAMGSYLLVTPRGVATRVRRLD